MAGKQISLDSLPFDVIENILKYDIISSVDICRLSSVSSLFKCIGTSNKLWRIKFIQKWPNLAVLYDANDIDWKEEFRSLWPLKKKINFKLFSIGLEFYYQDHVSPDSFSDFHNVYTDHRFSKQIIINELESVVYDDKCHENLTNKYYAKKALRFMKHGFLEKIWNDYLSTNSDELTMFNGSCLVAEWCQPLKTNVASSALREINILIQLVCDKLKTDHPNHPALKNGFPVLQRNSEILSQSKWYSSDCKKVLFCLNEVFYSSMKFSEVESMLSSDHSHIDMALSSKCGNATTLSIIYQTIAAQLGVLCLPLNFPSYFLLKWIENSNTEMSNAHVYIDVSKKGALMSLREIENLTSGYPYLTSDWLETVTPSKVFTKICWNLVELARQQDSSGEGMNSLCDSLELLYILSPDDMEHKLLLARVYMHLCINMTRVINLLQELTEQDPASTGIVGFMYRSAITTMETQKLKQRMQKYKCVLRDGSTEDVKFALGMIMRHKMYDYRCVIYGWDVECTASSDWKKQMSVHKLSNKDKQPFYHVLVEDGSNRYAAQENLHIEEYHGPVQHAEVGRYFDSFHGNYYAPNRQKRKEYPQDQQLRDQILGVDSSPYEY